MLSAVLQEIKGTKKRIILLVAVRLTQPKKKGTVIVEDI